LGEIQKQSIQGTIYTYIGVAIGFITTGILFPRFLETDEIGLLSLLVAYSMILSQLASLGFVSTTTRFFTYFRNQQKHHNGFLFIAMSVAFTGLILVLILFFIIKPYLIERSLEKSHLFVVYINWIIPLLIATLFFAILDHYYKVLYNAVIGIFLKELVQRILILTSFLLFYFKILTFHQFVVAYVASISFPTIIIIIVLIWNSNFNLKPQLKFLTRDLIKNLFWMSLFGIIASATGVITLNIDRIMIDNYMGLSPTGIYTTAFFFGTLVILPARALAKISSAFIADAWKDNDLEELNTIYFKSAINQFIFGLLILLGLWANINNIFIILPEEFLAGKYVILFIGLAYLLDMLIGVNANIIANSVYYRWHAVFIILMVILIVIFNIIFIPRYGIVGAALAAVLSKLAVNTLRVIFLYIKYKMMPYNYKFIIVLVIGIIAYLLGWLIPPFNNFIVDILVRSTVITIVFGGLILITRVSVDINSRFEKVIQTIKNLK